MYETWDIKWTVSSRTIPTSTKSAVFFPVLMKHYKSMTFDGYKDGTSGHSSTGAIKNGLL